VTGTELGYCAHSRRRGKAGLLTSMAVWVLQKGWFNAVHVALNGQGEVLIQKMEATAVMLRSFRGVQ